MRVGYGELNSSHDAMKNDLASVKDVIEEKLLDMKKKKFDVEDNITKKIEDKNRQTGKIRQKIPKFADVLPFAE